MMAGLSEDPPMFLIVAAVVATLAVVAIVLIFVVGSIRREQRGFDVSPPPAKPEDHPPAGPR